MRDITIAVLTISDTCYQDAGKDRSGPRLVELLRKYFQNTHIITEILPDECEIIRKNLHRLIAVENVAVIITSGGTGFAPRDVTPEATKPLLTKECPQLSMAIALASMQKTKFAALSRGICGIAHETLVLNFPGSEKAVVECFEVVRELLPHALHLINNDLKLVQQVHAELQQQSEIAQPTLRHICPHKTNTGVANDRNSPFEMIAVAQALEFIFQSVRPNDTISQLLATVAAVNIPPFRASIKDGYAMKSSGFAGTKKVIGCISAGDEQNSHPLQEDECFKINTGAAVPEFADCVIQVEDTKLLKSHKDGDEDLVEILVEPKADLDIRPIGCDLRKGSQLFPAVDHSDVVLKSVLASTGRTLSMRKPTIGIVSTGNELLAPQQPVVNGKIFDSNTTMLHELLEYFGFECAQKMVLSDNFNEVKKNIAELFEVVDFVICSGGVSMGDKDYIKPVLQELDFDIKFGRVNMKPGKPMTYATNNCNTKHFFGLPGNPVSAFVTFHLFVLPALRFATGWARTKCELTKLQVKLQNDSISLDPRPEYMRATLTSCNGSLIATINGNQMSSRLQSIVGADVLVHLPASTAQKSHVNCGDVLNASVLRYDFITKYE